MTPDALLRRVRRALGGAQPPPAGVLRAQRRAAERAHVLVAVFYAANLFFAFGDLRRWPQLAASPALEPLWPVAWVPALGIAPSVHAIMALLLGGAAAAALFPRRRAARIAAFAGVFLFHALLNSFGKINHSFHAWLLTAFLLIFLPDGSHGPDGRPGSPISPIGARLARQQTLNVFRACQVMQMLVYTMAGTWKALSAVPQIARGEVHAFAPTALAHHIAHRLLQTDGESLLGAFFVAHPLPGWPFFLLTLYLQSLAVFAAFRPSLHRWWGFGLIGFHFMVYLTMKIAFGPPVLLLGIFFLASPFAPARDDWRRALADLPALGPLVRRLLARPAAAAERPAPQPSA